ncbi:RNA polymerase sigma factor [Streptomyces sp. NPDC055025]
MLGDDAELTAAVLAAQDGDEDAFRTVYRAVHPRLLGYLRTLVGEPDAEDVASEAWLQIARDLARFTGDADRFRGWAARIARNRALDHIRMRGRRPAIGADETELTGQPAESDTEDEAMEALATGRTMALIARLPQDQAEAVVLRVVVGLDAKSAARTLGKRPGAVRTAAHRGLKRLAELLDSDEERPGYPDNAGGTDGSRENAYFGDGPPGTGAGGASAAPAAGTSAGTSARTSGAAATGTGDAPDSGGRRTAHRASAGHGGGLGVVPQQRTARPEVAASAGVTHSRLRTQRDM